MKTKISVMAENTVEMPKNAIGEHGLSMLIEREDATLFDTGQGFALMHNMKALFKDPAAISRIVLSHGHYDHTGGLKGLLESQKREIPVFAHPEVFTARVARYDGPQGPVDIAIDMPNKKEEYEALGARFVPAGGRTDVTEGITAFADIPRPAGWKGFDARLKQKTGDAVIDDPFNDDLSLLLETESGPVVLLGCAHAGLVEILDHIAGETGHRSFHAVIGGTHLGSAPPEYLERAIGALEKYGVKIVATSHCTGFRAAAILAGTFGERFRTASVGSAFEF
ncbi:MAG: MBL fold metallo-hydrolase [Spirochaetes bacterium]|nr:MBL fold metallo-hydrolase [Spirochaetota bacterium]